MPSVMATLEPRVCIRLLGCNMHWGVRVVPAGKLSVGGSEDISGHVSIGLHGAPFG